MVTEKQLQKIEKELKLLKGELKQTLASVRDYLLNTALPASGPPSIPSKPGNGGGQPVDMKNSFSLPPEVKAPADSENRPPEEVEPEADESDPFLALPGLSLEDQLMEYKKTSPELDKSVPGVNLLANLISWIAIARKEIGDEQLPMLLEVYGISGHLSPEMKDIVLNLAHITSEKTGENSPAESWSNTMLSLHGILTGSNAPLNPVKPYWKETDNKFEPADDETICISEEPKETPVKLKLVFANGGGKGKEYYINLTPESDNGGSESRPSGAAKKDIRGK